MARQDAPTGESERNVTVEDSECADPSSSVDARPSGSSPTPPPTWFRALAPVILVGAAVALHFSLNVPEHIPESDRDQGAKRKRARPRRGPVAKNEPRVARDAGELAGLWAQFRDQPFKAEPVDDGWARASGAVVSKAVVVARKHAFEGAPEDPRVIVTGTKCKTIRCQFTLRSPFVHELDLLVQTLRTVEVEGEPLWQDFRTEMLETGLSGGETPESRLRVTVALALDDVDTLRVSVADVEPAADADESDGADAPAAASAGGSARENLDRAARTSSSRRD